MMNNAAAAGDGLIFHLSDRPILGFNKFGMPTNAMFYSTCQDPKCLGSFWGKLDEQSMEYFSRSPNGEEWCFIENRNRLPVTTISIDESTNKIHGTCPNCELSFIGTISRHVGMFLSDKIDEKRSGFFKTQTVIASDENCPVYSSYHENESELNMTVAKKMISWVKRGLSLWLPDGKRACLLHFANRCGVRCPYNHDHLISRCFDDHSDHELEQCHEILRQLAYDEHRLNKHVRICLDCDSSEDEAEGDEELNIDTRSSSSNDDCKPANDENGIGPLVSGFQMLLLSKEDNEMIEMISQVEGIDIKGSLKSLETFDLNKSF